MVLLLSNIENCVKYEMNSLVCYRFCYFQIERMTRGNREEYDSLPAEFMFLALDIHAERAGYSSLARQIYMSSASFIRVYHLA